MKIQRLLIVPKVREISHHRTRATWSVAAVHDVPAPAQALSEHALHRYGFRVRHRIQMGIELRDQSDPKLLTTRAALIPFLWSRTLLWRQARHADVVAGAPIAFRIAQVHDVHRMMVHGIKCRRRCGCA